MSISIFKEKLATSITHPALILFTVFYFFFEFILFNCVIVWGVSEKRIFAFGALKLEIRFSQAGESIIFAQNFKAIQIEPVEFWIEIPPKNFSPNSKLSQATWKRIALIFQKLRKSVTWSFPKMESVSVIFVIHFAFFMLNIFQLIYFFFLLKYLGYAAHLSNNEWEQHTIFEIPNHLTDNLMENRFYSLIYISTCMDIYLYNKYKKLRSKKRKIVRKLFNDSAIGGLWKFWKQINSF